MLSRGLGRLVALSAIQSKSGINKFMSQKISWLLANNEISIGCVKDKSKLDLTVGEDASWLQTRNSFGSIGNRRVVVKMCDDLRKELNEATNLAVGTERENSAVLIDVHSHPIECAIIGQAIIEKVRVGNKIVDDFISFLGTRIAKSEGNKLRESRHVGKVLSMVLFVEGIAVGGCIVFLSSRCWGWGRRRVEQRFIK